MAYENTIIKLITLYHLILFATYDMYEDSTDHFLNIARVYVCDKSYWYDKAHAESMQQNV